MASRPADRPAAEAWGRALRRAATPWSKRLTVGAAIALVLIAVAALSQLSWNGDAVRLPRLQSVPEITVLRKDRVLSLSNTLPLRVGDRVAIACDISADEPAIVLWLDAAGQLHRLEPSRVLVDQLDRVTYPPLNQWMPLEPPAGTEMVFVCRGTAPSDAELNECFTVGQSPPRLPAANYLTLKRGRVVIAGPLKPASDEAHSVATVQNTVEQINRSLGR